jgi:CheY-like chemotaxis protein
MIKLALEHSGYGVDTAPDGSEGLKKFGDGKSWDLVVLDHRMPGMTGLDVENEIFKRSPNTRLILISAFGTIDLALEAIQAGASDFLRKPFTTATLRSAVQTALDRPAERMTAVPVKMACKEFTRTTINGYSFELDHKAVDDQTGDVICKFQVNHAGGPSTTVKVILHAYVMELVKAYSDSETMPGEIHFWQAMCEEALADYLWQKAAIPADNRLQIEDLSSSLQRWLDSVLTVCLAEDNGR